ncbi:MAG: hypothetical protein JXB88_13135 [Spirochaetales bacterium]|nr:hypothetical protein [Spirochaetales bacterium]
MDNKFKLLVFIIITLALSMNCCDIMNYREKLDSEYSNYFLDTENTENLMDLEFNKLEKLTGTEYLKTLYEILIENGKLHKKRSIKFIGKSHYYISGLLMKLTKYFSTGKENLNLCFKIFTEFNKQGDYDYVYILFSGMYTNYYKLITDFRGEIKTPVLKAFILSLPDLKLFILSAYKGMKVFKQKINYHVFWNTYNNISKDNYKQMLKNPELLTYLSEERINDYLNGIESYLSLIKLQL